jgi:hypothetical protein
MNKELITENELLELGFFKNDRLDYGYYETDYYKDLKVSYERNGLTIRVKENFEKATLIADNGWRLDETIVFSFRATKENILKIIELTKLIGELE